MSTARRVVGVIVGLLLLLFIVVQRAIVFRSESRR